MKRLVTKHEPIIIYNRQPLPNTVIKSIFLAGPTPRKDLSMSWRKEFVDCLIANGYDGLIIVPEEHGQPFNPDNKKEQIDWEYTCMCAADCIVFWIPRQFRSDFEMIALTTNVEFGRFLNSHKLVIGGPKEAVKNEYLQHISQNQYKWHFSMEECAKTAIKFVGEGIRRTRTECKIPAHIFASSQFQNWYQPMKTVGNSLTDFQMEYEFFMPKAKQLFLAIWKPSIYINESSEGFRENRIKSNEFVIARTDMSYICAFCKNTENIMDSEIVVCEEFRSPVVNQHEMIFELPGGSSVKDNEERLQVASNELKEETGLTIPANRFQYLSLKQSAGTLCSHRIALFSVELSHDEINRIRYDKQVHGVIEDTECIHLHVMKAKDAFQHMDWTNIGLVNYALQQHKI